METRGRWRPRTEVRGLLIGAADHAYAEAHASDRLAPRRRYRLAYAPPISGELALRGFEDPVRLYEVRWGT